MTDNKRFRKRMALIRLSPDHTRIRLGLNNTVEIIGARWDFDTHNVIFYLSGPELPELIESDPVPEINPALLRP